ncbi:MAG TPA: hypothetical protein VGO47_09655 [Chlamydiales bacterium]|nr:hypothetical protein [Chlamydiales bacterium]
MPPDIPSFKELLNPPLPGIKGRIIQALPVRSNRQEVNTSKLASETTLAMPQINVAPQIFLPPMNHNFQTPMSKYNYMDAPSFSPGDIVFPTIDEWLASLDGPAVGQCDIQAIRNKFEKEKFLFFPLDLLEDYKISSFGPNGSKVITQAEEALLSFKLKRTMIQLRKVAKEGKGQ